VLGLIGGTSLLYSELPELGTREIHTPYGPAVVRCGDIALLMRHEGGRPPHRINHRANLAALALIGVDRIVSFGSAGSLTQGIPPGSLAVPADYLSLTDIPSIHDHAIAHVMPDAVPGGRYIQTRGPRIETVAEVRALARIADLVGMTLASEATLARELGMEFAALCTVDNYANGLGTDVLTYDHILRTAKEHADRTGRVVGDIIGRFG
jgi:5'-methylthioadenosine phosphorylase